MRLDIRLGTCWLVMAAVGCTISSGTSKRRGPPPPPPGQYVVPQQPMAAQAPPPAAAAPPPPVGFQLPPPPNAASIPLPNGWVNIGGIPVPAVPGLTMPAPGQPGPAAPPPSSSALSGCGTVQVGRDQIPLDCMTQQYGFVPSASSVAVRRQLFDAGPGYTGAEPVPAAVDHRAGGKEGPVRNQGPVGACTAFSLATAVDHALAQTSGRAGNVSVMQIWARYHYPGMGQAVDANRGQSLGLESAWSYDRKQACSWYSAPGCDCGPILGTSCGQPVNTTKLSSMDKASTAKITNITKINGSDAGEMKAALAKGQDIWFAMYVDGRFQEVRGANAVVPDVDMRASRSGHAMVVSGYKTQGNGTYFLLHNSWGTSWGDGGYAWIHENTLVRNMKYAYLVEVATTNAKQPDKPNSPGEPAPPSTNPGQCPAGTVPDSGLPFCLPPCPDGSPRHFNTCPQPQAQSGCGPGQVNVFGFCVNSPKQGWGSDSSSGVRYTCGAGGCSYAVPYGALGCRGAICMRSCPSPKYLLTTGPLGLGCSE